MSYLQSSNADANVTAPKSDGVVRELFAAMPIVILVKAARSAWQQRSHDVARRHLAASGR
jgi:hypothetical protein